MTKGIVKRVSTKGLQEELDRTRALLTEREQELDARKRLGQQIWVGLLTDYGFILGDVARLTEYAPGATLEFTPQVKGSVKQVIVHGDTSNVFLTGCNFGSICTLLGSTQSKIPLERSLLEYGLLGVELTPGVRIQLRIQLFRGVSF